MSAAVDPMLILDGCRPVGLGSLDVSLATMVSDDARARGVGVVLDDFLPPSWTEDALVVGPGRGPSEAALPVPRSPRARR